MLKSNGKVFLHFLGSMSVFEAYREIAKVPKWAPYMKDVEDFITPYQDEDRPDVVFKRLMIENGFKNVHVEIEDMQVGECEIHYTLDKHKCKLSSFLSRQIISSHFSPVPVII